MNLVEGLWLTYIPYHLTQYFFKWGFYLFCVRFVCLLVSSLDLRALRNELPFSGTRVSPTTPVFSSSKSEEWTFLEVRLSPSTGARRGLNHSLRPWRVPFLHASLTRAPLRFQQQSSSRSLPSIHLTVSHYFHNCLWADNSQIYNIDLNFLSQEFQTHISNHVLDVFVPLEPQNFIIFKMISFNNSDYLN